jgi:hypothetical protein
VQVAHQTTPIGGDGRTVLAGRRPPWSAQRDRARHAETTGLPDEASSAPCRHMLLVCWGPVEEFATSACRPHVSDRRSSVSRVTTVVVCVLTRMCLFRNGSGIGVSAGLRAERRKEGFLLSPELHGFPDQSRNPGVLVIDTCRPSYPPGPPPLPAPSIAGSREAAALEGPRARPLTMLLGARSDRVAAERHAV